MSPLGLHSGLRSGLPWWGRRRCRRCSGSMARSRLCCSSRLRHHTYDREANVWRWGHSTAISATAALLDTACWYPAHVKAESPRATPGSGYRGIQQQNRRGYCHQGLCTRLPARARGAIRSEETKARNTFFAWRMPPGLETRWRRTTIHKF